ncbi:MAG: hypothetical protein J7M27_01175 [Candidatus Latescibacteria bacterium]|nr:hypothetical protein [Candidatus Latescibacterota bacterium]
MWYRFLILITLILSPKWAIGASYQIQIDTTWTMPRGVVRLDEDGSAGLKRFRKDVNVASEPLLQKFDGEVTAESNPGAIGNIVDGRTDTWWKPDAKDPVDKWKIKIDLGKSVATKKVRLTFADTVAFGDTLKPFERFSVYVSNGTGFKKNVPQYRLLGRADQLNRDRVMEYDITYEDVGDTTDTGESVVKSLDLDLVQFIRVIIDVPNTVGIPALAGIEVEAAGDNIAFLTEENGGGIKAYEHAPAFGAYDGHAGTFWQFTPVADPEWAKNPTNPLVAACFEWDLGAAFWIDQIYLDFGKELGIYAGRRNDGNDGVPQGYILMTSDGSPRPGGPVEWPPGGKYSYELLVDMDNRSMPHQYHFNHEFKPRKVRYIFFRMAHGFMSWGRGSVQLYEMQLFGEGYPAEAVLTSPPKSVAELVGGTGSKLVSALSWEAEQPLYPMTRVEVQTRSGNTLDTLWVYYKKVGTRLTEVTEEQYYKLRKVQKGPRIATGFKPVEEKWSPWSAMYREEGPFLSPSPRSYVQFRVKLMTDEPDVAPVFKGIHIEAGDPLMKQAAGLVEPRVVRDVDRVLTYTYRVWPEVGPGDRGFDRVLIRAPVVEDAVYLKMNGDDVQPVSVKFGADSLLVRLPRLAMGDSVDVRFKARISQNGIIFDAFLGLPDTLLQGTGMVQVADVLWQKVDPCEPGATSIFLPSLAEKTDLIGNLQATRIFTPNDDGVNDRAEIVFSLLKVEGKEPEVVLYDLNGRLIRILPKEDNWRYLWDGRDGSGELVSAGIYICRIRVESDARDYAVYRTVGVVY